MLAALAPDGGVALTVARAMAVAGLGLMFGTLTVRLWVIPHLTGSLPDVVTRRLRRLTQGGAVAALLALLAWLALQAAALAGQWTWAAVPEVLTGTRFGHVLTAQALLTLAVVGLPDGARRVRTALATLALALQAGHGHAASMPGAPGLLLLATVVHVLGAGAWLGGLPALLLLVRDAPARMAASAARWFTPLGKVAVVGVAASAALQGWVLVGSTAGLLGTAYGGVVLVKLGLLGVLTGFAVVNRYRLAPALLRDRPVAARRALLRSIAVQTGFGVLVVLAAALLSGLAPAMHAQPVWPFAYRFTLDTLAEDPDFRTEVWGAGLALMVAVLLLAGSLRRTRLRWPAVAAAAALVWFAVPHLDLLFVPAYPTSFQQSPTGFTAAAIMRGATLYPAHCAACHGADGRGDGPAAAALPVPPANLTAPHLWMHSDGELLWWLEHGIIAPNGQPAMPGFAGTLSDDDLWALIDAIRARNAGLTRQETGAWSPPVQAPGLQAACEQGPVTLADLAGGFVRVVAGGTPSALPGVTTVVIGPAAGLVPSPGLCVSADADAVPAYGMVAGLTQAATPGTAFLVDPAGWLRAEPPGWDDPARLGGTLAAATPIAAPAGHSGMRM